MLHPTHHRYGQVFGFGGAAVAATLGYIPTVDLTGNFAGATGSALVALLFILVCYHASVFGSEYPDIDSPGSIPARKHFFLQKMFKLFKVKHRGKYSHDFISLLLTFGSIYLFLSFVFGPIMHQLLLSGVGDKQLTPLVALLSSDLSTGEDGLLLQLLKCYALFALIGSYSHLIADASTKQGVWLLWSIKIHIVPVFITKIKIGGEEPFREIFNTGTGWEMLNRNALTYVALPLSILFCLVTFLGIKLF